MAEETRRAQNGQPMKRLSLMERLQRLEERHEEQGVLLAEALAEIRRLRACVTRAKTKRNGTVTNGLC